MNSRGLSLAELMVVIAIIGIILSISTLNFSQMTRKGKDEAAVRELYSNIQTAQMDSLRTCRRHQVDIRANSYVIRRYSLVADAAGTVRVEKQLKQTLTTSSSVPVRLRFSEKSYPSVHDLSDNVIAAAPFAICLGANDAGAAVDSIVVSQGTINLARKRSGGSCAPADCDLK